MALLGDVPARDADGRPVPSVRWERIGRRAGIVRDADWEARLPEAIADAADRGPTEVAAAASLKAFVDDLRSALGAPSDVRRWSDWVAWSHERLDWWFGRRGLDRLEGVERDAWERTQLVLTRLGHLDSIGPPVTRAEFRATFVAELEVAPARHGKVGDGVHVGALAGAGGLDVDLVVVVGAADGLLPPPPEVDPLLGDAERVAAGLVGSEERVTAAHRQFLAAVGHDARQPRHGSPWRPAGGGRQPAVAMARGARRRAVIRSWTTVHSHAHALASTVFPVSEAEHRRRHLWTHVRAGGDVRDFAASDRDPRTGAAAAGRPCRRRALRVRRRPVLAPDAASHRPGVGHPHRAVATLPARLLRPLRARRSAARRTRGDRGAVAARPWVGDARRDRPAPAGGAVRPAARPEPARLDRRPP